MNDNLKIRPDYNGKINLNNTHQERQPYQPFSSQSIPNRIPTHIRDISYSQLNQNSQPGTFNISYIKIILLIIFIIILVIIGYYMMNKQKNTIKNNRNNRNKRNKKMPQRKRLNSKHQKTTPEEIKKSLSALKDGTDSDNSDIESDDGLTVNVKKDKASKDFNEDEDGDEDEDENVTENAGEEENTNDDNDESMALNDLIENNMASASEIDVEAELNKLK